MAVTSINLISKPFSALSWIGLLITGNVTPSERLIYSTTEFILQKVLVTVSETIPDTDVTIPPT